MGGSSAQTPVTQQTTQTRDPWSAAQPHLQNAMQSAANFYNANVGYQPYAGQTQTGLDPLVSQGLQGQYSTLLPMIGGSPGVKAGQALGLQQMQNNGLSPQLQQLLQQQQGQENPYLQSILASNNQRIGDRINASMSGAGRYGSGQHTDVMARSLAEMANPILAQDYTRRQQMQQDILQGGLQRAGQWAQIMPGLDQAQLMPAQQIGAVGQYYQDRAQGQLNDQIKLYNAQQAYPWEQLGRLNAIIGGAGGLGGTTVTNQPGAQQPGTLQRVFGGGLAGAGIGGSFGGVPGAGVGALGGGLLGLLG